MKPYTTYIEFKVLYALPTSMLKETKIKSNLICTCKKTLKIETNKLNNIKGPISVVPIF